MAPGTRASSFVECERKTLVPARRSRASATSRVLGLFIATANRAASEKLKSLVAMYQERLRPIICRLLLMREAGFAMACSMVCFTLCGEPPKDAQSVQIAKPLWILS